jgi:hypothetical protein
VNRRDRDQHGGHPYQRMKCRDELRHLRHLDALCDHCADDPADRDATEDVADVFRVRKDECQRHDDRDRHPDDAEHVAAPRRRRMRQAFQCEDEADRRDQVPECDLVCAHDCAPTLAAAVTNEAAALPPEGE